MEKVNLRNDKKAVQLCVLAWRLTLNDHQLFSLCSILDKLDFCDINIIKSVQQILYNNAPFDAKSMEIYMEHICDNMYLPEGFICYRECDGTNIIEFNLEHKHSSSVKLSELEQLSSMDNNFEILNNFGKLINVKPEPYLTPFDF